MCVVFFMLYLYTNGNSNSMFNWEKDLVFLKIDPYYGTIVVDNDMFWGFCYPFS